uniref:IgE HMM5 heavy chain n=1 Tax=Homo sapiens TaxID=9606 RepID=UPI0030BA2B1D
QSLEESGGRLVTPGTPLTLTCTVSGFSLSTYNIHWVRQAPGKGLEWIGVIDTGGGTYFASWAKGRFAISKTSSTTVDLKMTSLTAADTATYFCAKGFDYSASTNLWGPGTLVTISSASTQSPSVFPLTRCCKNIPSNATSVTLGCLATGYFPEPVMVTWDTGSLNGTTMTLPATTLTLSGHYATISLLTVSGAWAKQMFTCRVAHTPSSTDWVDNKTFSVCSRDFTPPTVKILQSSCDGGGHFPPTIQLLCLVSGYTPGTINITWLEDGQVMDVDLSTASTTQEGELASTQSELTLSQKHWLSDRTYTCQVTYQGHTFEDSTKKCADSNPRGVSAYLSRPSPFDLFIRKSPTITCLVVDLAPSKGTVNLTWSRASGKPVNHSTRKEEKQRNGTLTVTSTLPVGTRDWIEGETYQCRVTHPHLPRALMRSTTKTSGPRAAPEVYAFATPEWPGSRDKRTLACLIQNFMPEDISVQWLHNEVQLPDARHSTTQPRKTKGSGFFVFSRLEVTRAEWEQKDEFICRAVHEAASPSQTVQRAVSSVNPGKHHHHHH